MQTDCCLLRRDLGAHHDWSRPYKQEMLPFFIPPKTVRKITAQDLSCKCLLNCSVKFNRIHLGSFSVNCFFRLLAHCMHVYTLVLMSLFANIVLNLYNCWSCILSIDVCYKHLLAHVVALVYFFSNNCDSLLSVDTCYFLLIRVDTCCVLKIT